MQNLGQLGPENCRVYVFFFVLFCFFFFFFVLFCFVLFFVCLFDLVFFFGLFCFVFVFCFSSFFFSFFFPLPPLFFFFNSSPDLNFHLYSILHDFSFKNTQFSASERAHPPQTPPVCASMQLALTLHQIISQCRRRMYIPL